MSINIPNGTGVEVRAAINAAFAFVETLISNSIPAGMIMYYTKNEVPIGWLECNGAAVSRATYSALFSAIGTTYGSGDGSTTFNLPDLRGVFVRGYDHDRGLDTTSLSGNTTNGSAVISNLSSTTILKVGMPVSGSGIPSGTTIVTIDSSTQITLSANATATATGVTLTFIGRIFGSLQDDQNQSHTHLIGKCGYCDPPSGFYHPDDATNAGNIYTGASGGTESRPKNVALLPCIKY